MIYKNGIKEYLLMALIFGAPIGMLVGLSTEKLIVGMVFGVLGGGLFSFSMCVFASLQEVKFEEKRSEIANDRRVLCEGPANVCGNGGWLFLTEDYIEFYPHKLNFSSKEIKIPAGMVEMVKTHKKQIVITTFDNTSVTILVAQNKEWKKQIDVLLINRQRG